MRHTHCALLVSIILAIISTFTINAEPIAESNHNILPLGPSEHRYIIDKIEKDTIMNTETGNTTSIQEIIDQTPETNVYIIGEAHDNYQCHTFQRDFIEALYKKHPQIIVGFEFFQRQDNELLEKWRLGEISEAELLEKSEWYKKSSLNYGYTRLIMEIIKKYKIKTIGLNIPRTILRDVSRKGFQELSPKEKALFPTIDIPNPQHEYFIKSIFGTFAVQVPFWFTNIYSAQKCWDVIMAESMRQELARDEFKDHKGIIIAGSNHVAYHLGIPFRYRKAQPEVKLTTIVPILIEEKKKDNDEDEDMHPMMRMMGKSLPAAEIFSRGIADYVFSAVQPPQSHFPTIGFSLKEQEGKFIVSRVAKDSIAEKNGISKGDQITTLEGVKIESLQQLRLVIAGKAYGDSLKIGIIKQMDIK